MHRLSAILFAIAMLTGCPDHPGASQRTTFSDSAGIRIAYSRVDSTTPVCSLSAPVVRIGAVAGDSAHELFGVRDAARLDDGRIAVLNAGTWQVRIFDSTGAHVTTFGRRGQGPGEFKNLWSLDLSHPETLVIGEYRPWRFSYFTDDGAFLRSVETRPPVIERPEVALPLSGKNGFLVGERCCETPDQGFGDRTIVMGRYDRDGALRDTLGTFWYQQAGYLSRELRYVGGPIFGARAAFALYGGDTLVYASGRSEQLELWSSDGELTRLVRWAGRDRRVRAEDVEEWKRAFRESYPGGGTSPEAQQWLEAEVGDHRPVADEFPAHEEWSGLLASRDGRFWVQEFRRPFDEGERRWLVFHPSGELACRVMVPEGMALLDVGEDWVLARERDDLQVEYVIERRLGPPVSPQVPER